MLNAFLATATVLRSEGTSWREYRDRVSGFVLIESLRSPRLECVMLSGSLGQCRVPIPISEGTR